MFGICDVVFDLFSSLRNFLFDNVIFLYASDCKKFMEKVQEVAESQKSIEENEDATAAAGHLEKLSVEEKKTEEKAGEEVPAAADKEEKESKTEDAEKKDQEKPAPST
jgi:Ran-binding protein 1